MPKLISPKVIFLGLLSLGFVHAGQAQQNLKAHTHGSAKLTVLYEDGQLIMELESPADNLLGFEHKPQNAQQRQQVEQLNKNLKDPATVVGLKPSCVIRKSNVNMPFSEIEPAEQAHEHGEHHAHKHEADTLDNHKDILLHYEWRCDGNLPPRITVNLFQHFSGLEKIEVQWIMAGKQGGSTLTKSQSVLKVVP